MEPPDDKAAVRWLSAFTRTLPSAPDGRTDRQPVDPPEIVEIWFAGAWSLSIHATAARQIFRPDDLGRQNARGIKGTVISSRHLICTMANKHDLLAWRGLSRPALKPHGIRDTSARPTP
jgi:hypothetical protein